MTTAKPVEHDDDFIQTRTSFEKTMRDRLARLDRRIDQLEARTDAAGHDAAVKLRARSDEIGSRMKQINDQAEAGWDRFERDLGTSVDSLEHDVDQLVY